MLPNGAEYSSNFSVTIRDLCSFSILSDNSATQIERTYYIGQDNVTDPITNFISNMTSSQCGAFTHEVISLSYNTNGSSSSVEAFLSLTPSKTSITAYSLNTTLQYHTPFYLTVKGWQGGYSWHSTTYTFRYKVLFICNYNKYFPPSTNGSAVYNATDP